MEWRAEDLCEEAWDAPVCGSPPGQDPHWNFSTFWRPPACGSFLRQAPRPRWIPRRDKNERSLMRQIEIKFLASTVARKKNFKYTGVTQSARKIVILAQKQLYRSVTFLLDQESNQRNQGKIIAMRTEAAQQARFFLPYAHFFTCKLVMRNS